MRRAAQSTIYDSLREEVSRNGAIKSPNPQSERPIIASAFDAAMDTSAIGQAATGGRSSRTYTGGGITPQTYTRPPMNTEDQLRDTGMIMNARAANPSRGITPRSPLMRRA